MDSTLEFILERLVEEDEYIDTPTPTPSLIQRIKGKFPQIPLSDLPTSDENPYGWDGKFLYIGGLNISGLFHEIAHYLIAPPETRQYINFGIGNGFNDQAAIPQDQLIFKTSTITEMEEKKACVLEWTLMIEFGCEQYVKAAMTEEGFGEADTELVIDIYKLLKISYQ